MHLAKNPLKDNPEALAGIKTDIYFAEEIILSASLSKERHSLSNSLLFPFGTAVNTNITDVNNDSNIIVLFKFH